MLKINKIFNTKNEEKHGVVSSVGRTPDCGSGGHRFNPDTTPNIVF